MIIFFNCSSPMRRRLSWWNWSKWFHWELIVTWNEITKLWLVRYYNTISVVQSYVSLLHSHTFQPHASVSVCGESSLVSPLWRQVFLFGSTAMFSSGQRIVKTKFSMPFFYFPYHSCIWKFAVSWPISAPGHTSNMPSKYTNDKAALKPHPQPLRAGLSANSYMIVLKSCLHNSRQL